MVKKAIPQKNLKSINKEKEFYWIQQGLRLHQQGELDKAKKIYLEVIKDNPQNHQILHLIGIIEALTQNTHSAVNYFKKASLLNNLIPEYVANLGNAQLGIGEHEAALENFDKAISLKKEFAEAHNGRGIALKALLRYEEAIASYEAAIKINPNYAEAFNNKGNDLRAIGKLEEALESYEQAIHIAPAYAEAFNNKGLTLKQLGQHQEALDSFDGAINIFPEYAVAFYNKASTYALLAKYEDAVNNYTLAIQIKPDFSEAFNNRGIALKELYKQELAVSDYLKAIEINPFYAEAYNNMGNDLKDLNKIEESIESYNSAINIASDYAEAHYNKCLALLVKGDFENAWNLYDWRWQRESSQNKNFKSQKPELNGLEDIHNKNILVVSEQGVGDEVMFAGLFDDLYLHSNNVVISADERLLPIYQLTWPDKKFIDKKIPENEISYDAYVYLTDLGKYLRKSITHFNLNRSSYLKINYSLSNNIKSLLSSKDEILCGISWRSKRAEIGSDKSITLMNLLPILSLPKFKFINLQYGDVAEELDEFHKVTGIKIHQVNEIDNFNDLEGHAVLVDACDFVVTISNTTAHMAGAIGKSTYLLSSRGKGSMWFWSNNLNGKNIWYPNTTVYQQASSGQWVDVIHNIKNEILIKYHDNK